MAGQVELCKIRLIGTKIVDVAARADLRTVNVQVSFQIGDAGTRRERHQRHHVSAIRSRVQKHAGVDKLDGAVCVIFAGHTPVRLKRDCAVREFAIPAFASPALHTTHTHNVML